MTDRAAERNGMREVVEDLSRFFEPTIKEIQNFTWVGNDADQFWEFLKRGIIVRQYEAILAILKMVEIGIGHFGVSLIRPSYEELLWIEYLRQNEALARELAVLLMQHEVQASLSAQNEYLGKYAMASIGFSQRFVKETLAWARGKDARLREIGRSLGWRDGQLTPAVAFIARKVKRESEYRFLYHGTSRYVHFSPQEVLRRVWGEKGRVRITSDHFTGYWSDFAMYWSIRIFIETIDASGLELNKSENSEVETKFLENLEALRPIQIITRTELESWNTK